MGSCLAVNIDCYLHLRLSPREITPKNTSTMLANLFFEIYKASTVTGGWHSSMMIATHLLDVFKRTYRATCFVRKENSQDKSLLHLHVSRMKHTECGEFLCGAFDDAALEVYAPLLLAAYLILAHIFITAKSLMEAADKKADMHGAVDGPNRWNQKIWLAIARISSSLTRTIQVFHFYPSFIPAGSTLRYLTAAIATSWTSYGLRPGYKAAPSSFLTNSNVSESRSTQTWSSSKGFVCSKSTIRT
jgi:hypothetical protein